MTIAAGNRHVVEAAIDHSKGDKTETYAVLLERIREAYRRCANGELRPSRWVREGASSYMTKSPKPR